MYALMPSPYFCGSDTVIVIDCMHNSHGHWDVGAPSAIQARGAYHHDSPNSHFGADFPATCGRQAVDQAQRYTRHLLNEVWSPSIPSRMTGRIESMRNTQHRSAFTHHRHHRATILTSCLRQETPCRVRCRGVSQWGRWLAATPLPPDGHRRAGSRSQTHPRSTCPSPSSRCGCGRHLCRGGCRTTRLWYRALRRWREVEAGVRERQRQAAPPVHAAAARHRRRHRRHRTADRGDHARTAARCPRCRRCRVMTPSRDRCRAPRARHPARAQHVSDGGAGVDAVLH